MKNLMFLLLFLGAFFGLPHCNATNLCLSAKTLTYPVYGIIEPYYAYEYNLYVPNCQKFDDYIVLMFYCLIQNINECSSSSQNGAIRLGSAGSATTQDLCYNAKDLVYPVYASDNVQTLPQNQRQKRLNEKNCIVYYDYLSLTTACQSRPKYACSVPVPLLKAKKTIKATAIKATKAPKTTKIRVTKAKKTKATKATKTKATKATKNKATKASKTEATQTIETQTTMGSAATEEITTTSSNTTAAPEYTGDLCNGYSDFLTTYGISDTIPCISGTDYGTNQCASNADNPDDCTEITDPVDVTNLCDSVGGTIYFC